MVKRTVLMGIVLACGLAVGLPSAHAAVLDLTAINSFGFLNGAFFKWTDLDRNATGTGLINPFVRLSTNHDTEQGYNTDGRPLAFDENNSPQFTKSIQLGGVPLVNINGTDYREFLLDINEPDRSGAGLLSLDKVQIYLNPTSGALNTSTLADLGALVFNLDIGPDGDSYARLNADLNPGQGKGDYFMYVPDSLFIGAGTQYVYLYSYFGTHDINDSGFEEWSHRIVTNPTCEQTRTCDGNPPPVIPEPSSLLLMGSGLFGAAIRFKRKRA